MTEGFGLDQPNTSLYIMFILYINVFFRSCDFFFKESFSLHPSKRVSRRGLQHMDSIRDPCPV